MLFPWVSNHSLYLFKLVQFVSCLEVPSFDVVAVFQDPCPGCPELNPNPIDPFPVQTMVGQVLGLYQKFIGQNPTHQGHVVEVVLPIVMNSQNKACSNLIITTDLFELNYHWFPCCRLPSHI